MESTETSPQSKPLDPSPAAVGKEGGEVSGFPSDKAVPPPWWLRAVPFFLSAFFFMSALFSIFSALPLLFLRFRSGRKWMWAAVVTNSVIVGLAAGRFSLAIYVVFVVALALTMGELIERRKSLEKTAALTLLSMLLCGAVLVSWYSHLHHVNPIQEFRNEISLMVDYLQKSVPEDSLVGTMDVEEWKNNLLLEFPSAIAVFALVLVWATLSTILRVNPSGIREKMGLDATFIRNWKAPEYLIWPTIISGFFLIVEVGRVSDVSLNVFRFAMAIYAIQGLSILSFFFDIWKVQGVFRTIGFLISIFLMMPLLLSLGFFDLWFDFRSKFRQS